MKKLLILGVLVGIVAVSCTNDITDYNVDPKRPSEVPAATTFTNAEKNLGDLVTTMSVGTNVFRLWAQHWTETTYNDEANYDVIGRDLSAGYWTTIYNNILNDLNSSVELINNAEYTDEQMRTNQLAVIEIVKVYSYQMLVDLNGDVPYSEALNINENLFPVYDDAETIYLDLIARVTAAQQTLSAGGDSFGSADIYYGGDTALWRKFANSLKLRLGMRLADSNPSAASTAVSEAFTAGVLTSSDDSAIIMYEDAAPNTNPLYDTFVLSGRGEDYIAGSTSVDYLLSVNDPRLDDFYDQNLGDDTYVGGPIGGNNSYPAYTHIKRDLVEEPTATGAILEYYEVEFFLAEAAERGFISEVAESHYDAAITASILSYGGTQAEVDAYLAQPDVAYATAAGNYEQKIGTQKWIALFNRGFEAWTEWRRLDYPNFLVLSDQSGLPVPTRVFYPTTEPAVNGANYDAAVAKQGGEDDLYGKIFWDVQ